MKVVVLLSGGVDSSTLLADQTDAGNECYCPFIDYGQNQVYNEVASSTWIASRYGARTRTVSLRGIFGSSALLGRPMPDGMATEPDATTVPGRNLAMLGLAGAYAMNVGAEMVMIGCNADDNAAFIDCRPEFLEQMDAAMQLGTGGVRLRAPYLTKTKAEVLRVADHLKVPLDKTWSCYVYGDKPCGKCGACETRRRAFERYQNGAL